MISLHLLYLEFATKQHSSFDLSFSSIRNSICRESSAVALAMLVVECLIGMFNFYIIYCEYETVEAGNLSYFGKWLLLMSH